MMVRLYDYLVPVADESGEWPNLRSALADLPTDERKVLLTSLFKPERMPGSMERLTTLVVDVDVELWRPAHRARQRGPGPHASWPSTRRDRSLTATSPRPR